MYVLIILRFYVAMTLARDFSPENAEIQALTACEERALSCLAADIAAQRIGCP